MELDLTRIRRAEERVERTLDPAVLVSEGDAYRVVTPVQLACDVRRDGHRFRLTGRVQGGLELTCSRCLEPFPWPVVMAFDHRYLPADEAEADSEVEVADDDLDTSYYRDDRIDLGELVREQFYLSLPMKPLCSEECRGLCPQCGTNLNTTTCACRTGWVDPRMAPLRDLQSH
ncbi:MAG: DUF177 domain-containing protein [Acidimicrobiia bacterium]|nr:DUF177 domain-containing protein [Acidimicrobiia bacterium]